MDNFVFPEIDLGELTSNASSDVFQWLCDAVSLIDENMGIGYAENNPGLIGDYIKASATAYAAERQVDAAEMIAKAILVLAKERGSHG